MDSTGGKAPLDRRVGRRIYLRTTPCQQWTGDTVLPIARFFARPRYHLRVATGAVYEMSLIYSKCQQMSLWHVTFKLAVTPMSYALLLLNVKMSIIIEERDHRMGFAAVKWCAHVTVKPSQ
jgi:hypothetical protein